MNKNILAAAVGGILLGASSFAHAQSRVSLGTLEGDTTQQLADTDKHACKGQNACKAMGGCKTDKHACKGQNACKGQGGCRTDGKDGHDAKGSSKASCAGKSGCGSSN